MTIQNSLFSSLSILFSSIFIFFFFFFFFRNSIWSQKGISYILLHKEFKILKGHTLSLGEYMHTSLTYDYFFLLINSFWRAIESCFEREHPSNIFLASTFLIPFSEQSFNTPPQTNQNGSIPTLLCPISTDFEVDVGTGWTNTLAHTTSDKCNF